MSTIENRPNLSLAEATLLFETMYGLNVKAVHNLDGERDQNLRVEISDTRSFVLKICNSDEPRSLLNAQNIAMQLLSEHPFVPKVLNTKDEVPLGTHSTDAVTCVVRAVEYLPGLPLACLKRPSRYLLEDFGHKLGLLDLGLSDFDDPTLHREFPWNLLCGIDFVQRHHGLIADSTTNHCVVLCLNRFNQRLNKRESRLRKAVIHNDANDYNVIVSPDRDEHGERLVGGIIDFGDMAFSYLVAELAIALAYVICRRNDWLTAACEMIFGYNATCPLEEVEIECLFDLMLLRLCTSVCMSEKQQRERPTDAYLSISQAPIRTRLPQLLEVDPRFVECRFRDACGLSPHPTSRRITDWLSRERSRFSPVMGEMLGAETTDIVDQSVSNSSPIDANHRHSIGGYNEARLIYSNEQFSSTDGGLETDERRTIHLGIDIMAPEGTPVFAPLRGTVVVNEFRGLNQDYGGLVVLCHQTDQGDSFYSLFGHLGRECLAHSPVGSELEAGNEVGHLGAADENGGWFPHLHFQLIVDLIGLGGEFPGVGFASERAVWRSLSPNPSALVGLDERLMKICKGSESHTTLEDRRRRFPSNLSIAYRQPVEIVRGKMQYLYDDTGRRFLDAYNNVPHVGHCHPRVVAAATQQMATLNTNTRYLHSLLNEYSKRITETLPESLDTCFFVNSASEANEMAIRLARAATNKTGVVVQDASYHGCTTTLIDLSPAKHDGPGGEGAPRWVHKLPLPDSFRGRFRGEEERCGRDYAEEAARRIAEAANGPFPPAAFLAETCPSVGGQIIPPSNYLPRVYDAVRAVGAITIADEVQTGFGRLGSHFWAFERFGVIPNIVVMGKPMGNGHPIAAVVTTSEIADRFNNGMEFFSTFGGNTVSCAIGLAVLDVLADEQLQMRSLETGRLLHTGLLRLQNRFSIIGDVRGSGLFWGVELVRDRETLEPADREALLIVNRMRDRGILIGTDGPSHNVLKIRPPMQFNTQNVTTLLRVLSEILDGEFA